MPTACPILENYQGRQIVLTSGQQEGGNWVCEYVILETGHTASPSTRGYPKGIFHSPSEATTAALLAAQTIIDSRAKAGKVVKSLAR